MSVNAMVTVLTLECAREAEFKVRVRSLQQLLRVGHEIPTSESCPSRHLLSQCLDKHQGEQGGSSLGAGLIRSGSKLLDQDFKLLWSSPPDDRSVWSRLRRFSLRNSRKNLSMIVGDGTQMRDLHLCVSDIVDGVHCRQ